MYKNNTQRTLSLAILLSCFFFLMPTLSDAKNNKKAKPIRLTPKSYKAETANGIVLVDFWASWCGPCRKMSPILDELANDKKLGLKVAKLNVDTYKAFAIEKGIQILPTLILYKDGKEIARFAGALTKEELKYKIKKALE